VKARSVDVLVRVRHLIECLDPFRHLNVEFVTLRESIDASGTRPCWTPVSTKGFSYRDRAIPPRPR